MKNSLKNQFIRKVEEKLGSIMIPLLNYYMNKTDGKEIVDFFSFIEKESEKFSLQGFSNIAKTSIEIFSNEKSRNDLDRMIRSFSDVLEEIRDYKNSEDEYTSLSKKEYTNITTSGNVLIIHNDLWVISSLEKVLSNNGYYVLITSNIKEAFQIIYNENIDLIFLDTMPNNIGFNIYKDIRKMNYYSPIIFISQKNNAEDRIAALGLGADDYLGMPFYEKELMARVEGCIQRKEYTQKNIILDHLTGAYTKKYFYVRIKEEKNLFQRREGAFSLAFIDLDKFKEINDNFGHMAGDYILQNFVDILKSNLRTTDQVFRFGGDEFIVIFINTNSKEAYNLLEKVRIEVEKRNFEFAGDRFNISFSAGITTIKNVNETIEEVMGRADKLLYKSKEQGRGKTSCSLDKEIKQQNILILDDENIFVYLVKARLQSLGYHVDCINVKAENMNEHLEEPDIVIANLSLIYFKAQELWKEISDKLDLTKIKLIGVLSKNEHNYFDYSEFKAEQYLMKPFSLDELETTIRKY